MDLLIQVVIGLFYLGTVALFIHAPVDMGIQAVHLQQKNSPYKAMITISAGWLLTLVIFLFGYGAGHARIFG